jgi:hypothetical protein
LTPRHLSSKTTKTVTAAQPLEPKLPLQVVQQVKTCVVSHTWTILQELLAQAKPLRLSICMQTGCPCLVTQIKLSLIRLDKDQVYRVPLNPWEMNGVQLTDINATWTRYGKQQAMMLVSRTQCCQVQRRRDQQSLEDLLHPFGTIAMSARGSGPWGLRNLEHMTP